MCTLGDIKLISLFLLIVVAAPGCVNRATVTLVPGADLSRLKTFYVVHQPRDNDYLHQMMSDNLSLRGYHSTAGPEMQPSSYKTDAIITYVDKWMWDITLYLLELTITVRGPTDGQPLAVGNSYHTSLTRLSPQEMVDEVLSNIFGPTPAGAKGAGKQPYTPVQAQPFPLSQIPAAIDSKPIVTKRVGTLRHQVRGADSGIVATFEYEDSGTAAGNVRIIFSNNYLLTGQYRTINMEESFKGQVDATLLNPDSLKARSPDGSKGFVRLTGENGGVMECVFLLSKSANEDRGLCADQKREQWRLNF